MLEVEVKARVPPGWDPKVLEGLASLEGVEQQEDAYFAHPARDFGATDEALRLRRVDDRAELTYKGPRIDTTTKTRREVTTDVGGFERTRDILLALEFSEVARVRKRRTIWRTGRIEIAVDDVDGLGRYVEVEALAGDTEDPARLREEVLGFLRKMGLAVTERRSYLELLLDQQRGG
ncbi:MAG TPA: class IV adenylate cyclase [Candidatus Thermoplasmatota archaeon]|nr:class IV adenylate cyclase [Candidatus Thermoplasmatota archaeon]